MRIKECYRRFFMDIFDKCVIFRIVAQNMKKQIERLGRLSLVTTIATLLLIDDALAGNKAELKISGCVKAIATVTTTQGGLSTGKNESYVTVHNGETTIAGNGLEWMVNISNVKIAAHSDGGLGKSNLSVRAINVSGGQSCGWITLNTFKQDVVSKVTFGNGTCSLEYRIAGLLDGSETVVCTISAE